MPQVFTALTAIPSRTGAQLHRDAENRLIGITYPGQAGKATAFAYDGLGRRTSLTVATINATFGA
jgi:YD repeat-containing protein